MLGQTNLFTFKPKIKSFHPTPLALNQELWAMVKATDDRGYSFGRFDDFYNFARKRRIKRNAYCVTVVLYKSKKEPIGFCTISLSDHYEKKPTAYIDVWVMPYYRDMGFGSLLVQEANRKSIELTGNLPRGFDKNRTHCWDIRFREKQNRAREHQEHDYIPASLILKEQLQQLRLFNEKEMEVVKSNTVSRLISALSKNVDLDSTLMRACIEGVKKVVCAASVSNARQI